MPKQALVLNGFGGGINKDSDATDLPSDGRGKDQVITMTNMLSDLGGKTYVSNYKFVAASLTVGVANNGTSDLLIFDDKSYYAKGLYKIGGDINWSSNLFKGPYVSQGFNELSIAGYIGLMPNTRTDGIKALFLGTGASGGGVNPDFGGTERSTDYPIHDFVKSIWDISTVNNYMLGETHWLDGPTMYYDEAEDSSTFQSMVGEFGCEVLSQSSLGDNNQLEEAFHQLYVNMYSGQAHGVTIQSGGIRVAYNAYHATTHPATSNSHLACFDLGTNSTTFWNDAYFPNTLVAIKVAGLETNTITDTWTSVGNVFTAVSGTGDTGKHLTVGALVSIGAETINQDVYGRYSPRIVNTNEGTVGASRECTQDTNDQIIGCVGAGASALREGWTVADARHNAPHDIESANTGTSCAGGDVDINGPTSPDATGAPSWNPNGYYSLLFFPITAGRTIASVSDIVINVTDASGGSGGTGIVNSEYIDFNSIDITGTCVTLKVWYHTTTEFEAGGTLYAYFSAGGDWTITVQESDQFIPADTKILSIATDSITVSEATIDWDATDGARDLNFTSDDVITEFTLEDGTYAASGATITTHDNFNLSFRCLHSDHDTFSNVNTTYNSAPVRLPISTLTGSTLNAGSRLSKSVGGAYCDRLELQGPEANGVHLVKIPQIVPTTTSAGAKILFKINDGGSSATAGISRNSNVYLTEASLTMSRNSHWALIKDISNDQENETGTATVIPTWHGGDIGLTPATTTMPLGHLKFANGTPSFASNFGDTSVGHNVTGAEAFRCNIHQSSHHDVNLVFRLGKTSLLRRDNAGIIDWSLQNGMFDVIAGLDIEDKNIYIEGMFDPHGILEEQNFDGVSGTGTVLNIEFDSQADGSDNAGGDMLFYGAGKTTDAYGVYYQFTFADIVAAGMWRAKGRLKIPSGSYNKIGHSHEMNNIQRAFVTVNPHSGGNSPFNGGFQSDEYDGQILPFFDLYEFSIADSGALGWSGTTVEFSQTDTTDNSSSLINKYSSTIEFGTNNKLSLRLHKPLTVHSGNIYYQLLNSDDDDFSGDKFLLAETDYHKGARKIGDSSYTPWTETIVGTVACTTAGSSNTTVTCAASDIITVGHFISGTGTIAGTYVSDVDEPGAVTSFTASEIVTGNETLTFSTAGLTFQYSTPPAQSTFELETGYPDNTTEINATWKTAATNGRQVYVGNIVQDNIEQLSATFAASGNSLTLPSTWLSYGFKNNDIVVISNSTAPNNNGTFKLTDITNTVATLMTVAGAVPDPAIVDDTSVIIIGIVDTDRILKGPPGKLYGFSDKSYVDLELGAGNINVLETAGDRLLVFSDDNLTIVNIAQDYEYLEASLPGYGILTKRQVAKVSEGVAFVNSAGVFFFDGNSVNNISDGAIDSLAWSNTSSISYDPSSKLIMAWLDDDDDTVYCYSLKTKAWVSMLTDIMVTNEASPQTNSVNYQGDMYTVDTDNAIVKLGTDSETRSIVLKTGRISCGNFAMEKSFKKLHINVLNPSAEFQIDLSIDSGAFGGAITTDEDGTTLGATGSGTYTIKIPADYRKGKDIGIEITDVDAPSDFEISDIQLLYANKRVK